MKSLRHKRAPNRNTQVIGSRRWKKTRKQISKLQRKVSNQRKDWQHKVTSDIASRHDIGVTEQLNTKGMTRKAKKGSKRKKQKAGFNKSILSVGFGTLNKMITYKIEHKGGLMLTLPTKQIKPMPSARFANTAMSQLWKSSQKLGRIVEPISRLRCLWF